MSVVVDGIRLLFNDCVCVCSLGVCSIFIPNACLLCTIALCHVLIDCVWFVGLSVCVCVFFLSIAARCCLHMRLLIIFVRLFVGVVSCMLGNCILSVDLFDVGYSYM